jgi:hypothetical protein
VDHQETDASVRLKRTALTLHTYADDIALVARRLPNLKEFFIKLDRAAKEVGLDVNEGKTNYSVFQDFHNHSQETSSHSVRVQLRACQFLAGKTCVEVKRCDSSSWGENPEREPVFLWASQHLSISLHYSKHKSQNLKNSQNRNDSQKIL